MDVPAEMLQNKDFVGGGGVGGEGEMKEEPGFDDSEYGPDSESGGAEPGRQRAKKRKGGKNDGDGDFVPPQHEISGDGSFDFGDDNGTEGNGHNNGGGGRGGGRRRNRDGESGDDFNWPSENDEGSAHGSNEPSYHPDGRRRRSKKFNKRDTDAAFVIMTELDPNNILSSGKWAGGFKEEKEKLLVAMHSKFSKVASRQVNLDQFKKFLSRIRTEKATGGKQGSGNYDKNDPFIDDGFLNSGKWEEEEDEDPSWDPTEYLEQDYQPRKRRREQRTQHWADNLPQPSKLPQIRIGGIPVRYQLVPVNEDPPGVPEKTEEAKKQEKAEKMKLASLSALAAELTAMRKRAEMVDLNLISRDGIRFPVHRSVLCARSEVFANMIKAGHPEIPIELDKNTMEVFLAYVYEAALPENLSFELAEILMAVADRYRVNSLIEGCVATLRASLSAENAIRAAVMGDRYRNEAFKKEALEVIAGAKTQLSSMAGWESIDQYPNVKNEIISMRARL